MAFLRGCKRPGVVPGIWVDPIMDGWSWIRRRTRFMTYGADFVMVMAQSRMVLAAVPPARKHHG